MKKISCLSPLVIGLIMASVLSAQNFGERDIVPLKNWDAPMYWQPSAVESKDADAKQLLAGNVVDIASITPDAQTPANSLVFVGMTPCRVVDTRTGSGFTGPFGPPNLLGGATRTFPIQSSSTCSIPPIAQAYSFNITLVTTSFVDFITVWPTGQPRPNASTLNGYVNTVIANAAVVPAGTSGWVDVYASQNTNLIIDINGYYAAQSGITLAQGTAGAPSLSFASDSGTGVFSSGAGTVNIATAGINRISVRPDGDLDLQLTGNIRKGGNLFLHSVGNANTGVGLNALSSTPTGSGNTATGWLAGRGSQGFSNISGSNNTFIGSLAGPGTATELNNATAIGANAVVSRSNALVLGDTSVNVGIGTTSPNSGKLHVVGGSNIAVYARSGTNAGDYGVYGEGAIGVRGNGDYGVYGFSNSVAALVASTSTGNLVEGYTGGTRKFHITNTGTYVTGSDFAEALPAQGAKVDYEPGDVLVLSTNVVGTVEKTSRTYDERVAGVYSTRPGMLGAEKGGGVTRLDAEDLPVAIIGIVPTKVSAESGPIQVGDLLTTSSTPGYAMRCEDRVKCLGATLGKAMQPLGEGTAVIKVLVTLR